MPRWTSRCTTSASPSPSTLAFRSGYSRSASTTARATNGRYVSEKPSAARHARLCSARTASIARVVGGDDAQRVRRRLLRREQHRRRALADVVERHELVAPCRSARRPQSPATSVARDAAVVRRCPGPCSGSMPRSRGDPPRRSRQRTPCHRAAAAVAATAARRCGLVICRRQGTGRILRRVANDSRVRRRASARSSLAPKPSTTCASAHISRFLDDREIALRQQNRVFFQISGRGSRSAAARARAVAAARVRLVLPVLPRPRARARARRHAARDPAAGGRLGRRPGVGRPADAVPLGRGGAQHRHPDVVHRQPVPPRGRVRGSGALHQPPPELPGCVAYGDELTYVSLGEGATSEGEFWESPEHRVPARTCRCSTSSPTTATRSRCARPTRRRRRSPRWCAASAACTS